MGKKLAIVLAWTLTVSASSIDRQIDDILRFQEQKEVFSGLTAKKDHVNIYTDLMPLQLAKDPKVGNCININRVIAKDITLISKNDIDKITASLLGKCSTIIDITNAVKRINNIYIEKAYITSRAYIKPQKLSDGILEIAAIEGKIESIVGKGVVTELVFPTASESYLNLRRLEMGIEQLNRLQSYQAKMSIDPSNKVGYSNIVMHGTRTSFPLHGTFDINNFGTEKSGKYQWSTSLDWENPLGWNDLLSLGYNTTNKQDIENQSRGYTLSYGLPIGQNYIKATYAHFKYKQIVNGLNKDYFSNGVSKSFTVDFERKLFHTKRHKGKIDISLTKKKNDNYLAGVYLDTSSSILTIMSLGYTHSYTADSWDAYITIKFHKGLDMLGAKTGAKTSPKFKKITVDATYNKRFKTKGRLGANYNFSFHGQYAGEHIIGSQQIGVGGLYSVRGFKNEGSLSGNIGFYIRNEFSFTSRHKWGNVSPYIGLDFGAVKHNKQSYGGKIIGSAIGIRANIKNLSLDIFATYPLYDSNKNLRSEIDDEVHSHGKKFIGFKASYKY